MKMNAFEELEKLIAIEKITAITTHSTSLSIPETLELMKDTSVMNLITDLTFWTKDEKIIIDEYEDEWNTDIELIKISLKPNKNLVKGTPESVIETWLDPKTRKHLPFKTDEYHAKQKELKEANAKRRAENEKKFIQEVRDRTVKLERYYANLPVVEADPFTIIKGGFNDNCRYITLPSDFPASASSIALMNDYYSKMNNKLRRVIDFIGYAGMENGRLETINRYRPMPRHADDSVERTQAFDKYEEVHRVAESDGRIVKVVGFCIESLTGLALAGLDLGTLDEVAEKLKVELEKL